MNGSDIRAQVAALEHDHKEIYDCLDLDRIESWLARVASGDQRNDDFGPRTAGGRGESYIAAQRATFNRAPGITALLNIIADRRRAESNIIVDLLGGDGLVGRVASAIGRTEMNIATCDASPFMVEKAWAAGIPALLQCAQYPLFRAGSVGGAFLAYGSHHVAPAERAGVVAEAHAILQPGGVFLLHDFLVGSAMERWFGEVVDVYSLTGHQYTHFDKAEIASYLEAAGFVEIDVITLDDPFVVRAATRHEAELAMGRHLVEMYGLARLVDECRETGAYQRAYELSRKIFCDEAGEGAFDDVPRHDAGAGTWTLTLRRTAVVGYGVT